MGRASAEPIMPLSFGRAGPGLQPNLRIHGRQFSREMAGYEMAGHEFAPLRLTRLTFRLRQRASRMKPASARRRQRTGNFTLQDDALTVAQMRRHRFWLRR